MSEDNNNLLYIVLFVMTRDWSTVIISSLVSKGFIVSAGFNVEKGSLYADDDEKISHIICLKIERKEVFTRKFATDILSEILKSNNISIFGGIAASNGDLQVLYSTIDKTTVNHPYR